MRMTKKKALKIAKGIFDERVQERYVRRNGTFETFETYLIGLPHLCFNLRDVTLNMDWNFYWNNINKRQHALMTCYFKHDYSTEEVILLRLLVLHQFIDEHYE